MKIRKMYFKELGAFAIYIPNNFGLYFAYKPQYWQFGIGLNKSICLGFLEIWFNS